MRKIKAASFLFSYLNFCSGQGEDDDSKATAGQWCTLEPVERKNIEEIHQQLGCKGNVRFKGRIPREEIIQYLKQADVFVMISKAEIFGLVYLEAMALGLIPIGSRNEGIDGIICDGDNGFLCEAGNVDELTEILQKIKEMPSEQLVKISNKAKQTAQSYSDEGVAKYYLENLKAWELQDIWINKDYNNENISIDPNISIAK